MSGRTEIRLATGESSKSTILARFGGGGEASAYEGIYFDTGNLDLRRGRVTLCLRQSGGRILQKIKVRTGNGNAFAWHTYELPLLDLQPNVDHLRAVLPAHLRDSISLSRLWPQFRTNVRRVSYTHANDCCIMRVDVDEGVIDTPGRRGDISEIELKLKSGTLESYSKACLSMLECVPTGLTLESKGARGYRLVSGELPQPIWANRMTFPLRGLLPEAILRVFRHGFQHFLDNHSAVTLSGEPESIHQMRVGIRRLRSGLRLFDPVLCIEGGMSHFEELRALFRRLGDVREADVFLGETLPAVSEAGLGERLETVLRREITAFREIAYGDVQAALKSPSFARLTIQMNKWIEAGQWLKSDRPVDTLLRERAAEDFVVPRMASLYRKLRRHASKARDGTLADWHRARIATKRLRYAGEPFFAAFAPSIDASMLAKHISRVQNLLGHLNDLETIAPFLARVKAQVQQARQTDFMAAEQFCRGWGAAKVPDFLGSAREAMTRLDELSLQS